MLLLEWDTLIIILTQLTVVLSLFNMVPTQQESVHTNACVVCSSKGGHESHRYCRLH